MLLYSQNVNLTARNTVVFIIIIWPCLKRTGSDQIQEPDWLKSILTVV